MGFYKIPVLFAFAVVMGFPGVCLAVDQFEGQHPLSRLAPAQGYIEAHKATKSIPMLMGGPVQIEVQQEGGIATVGLPGPRALDPDVFGTPDNPRGEGGTPDITGMPVERRAAVSKAYTQTTDDTLFSDKYESYTAKGLKILAIDYTATDASESADQVKLVASWMDEAGNNYAIRCCTSVLTYGVEFPSFGGVVTNHMLHGFTRIGAPTLPTQFAYFAFWGLGEVIKNGQTLDEPRYMQGMLSEYGRTSDYKLAFDRQVDPNKVHFQLIVPPYKISEDKTHFEYAPVKTGYFSAAGVEVPYWYVTFEQLTYSSKRLDTTAAQPKAGSAAPAQ